MEGVDSIADEPDAVQLTRGFVFRLDAVRRVGSIERRGFPTRGGGRVRVEFPDDVAARQSPRLDAVAGRDEYPLVKVGNPERVAA